MLALGQFIVIVTAGIDLSVGSNLALSMMSAAVLSTYGVPWPILIVVPFLVGATVSTINNPRASPGCTCPPVHHDPGHDVHAQGLTNIISGGVPIAVCRPRCAGWATAASATRRSP
ncbi:MAG: hypothetical protein U0869_06990 [Chloroflexota bacterium]